jgi:hypothetical protein
MNRSTRLLFLMLALALLLSGCSGGVPGPKPDLRGSNPLLVSATGRVFFVSATGGDDLNDGLSPEKPWKTLAKASDMIYAAGDVIALLAGDVWSAETFFGKGSGSEGKPIVLTYYGTGKRPELRIGDSTKGIGIRLYEASYWRVDNLHLSGGKLGIYLNYYTVGHRDVEISNCEFYDFNDGNIGDPLDYGNPNTYPQGWDRINEAMKASNSEYAFNAAINLGGRIMQGDLEKTVLDGWTIRDCVFRFCDMAVQNNWYYPVFREGRIRNVHFQRLLIEDVLMGGIGLTSVTGGEISDIYVRNGRTDVFCFPGYSGLFLYGCRDVTVTRNVYLDLLRAGDTDTCAIDFERCRNVTLEKTLIGRTDGQALILLDTPAMEEVGKTTSGHNEGILVRDSIFFDNLKMPYANPVVENVKFTLFSRNSMNTGSIDGLTIYQDTYQNFSRSWGAFTRTDVLEKKMADFPGEAAAMDALGITFRGR